jgi:tyrosyl-tRNA synthetase
MSAKCFSNISVAHKVINDGGVYVNHEKLSNPHAILVFGVHILPNMITVLRVGKRKRKRNKGN